MLTFVWNDIWMFNYSNYIWYLYRNKYRTFFKKYYYYILLIEAKSETARHITVGIALGFRRKKSHTRASRGFCNFLMILILCKKFLCSRDLLKVGLVSKEIILLIGLDFRNLITQKLTLSCFADHFKTHSSITAYFAIGA